MGRPAGSENKDKPFKTALRKKIAEAEGDPKRLDRIADKLYAMAEAGDMSAIREVADRLDGKPAQSLEHTGADGGPIETVEISADEAARRVAFTLANAAMGTSKPH